MQIKNTFCLAGLLLSFGSSQAIEIVNRPYGGIRAQANAQTPASAIPSATASSSAPAQVQVLPVRLPEPPQKTWTMDIKDVNYYGAFSRWASEAGYQVRWDADKHFVIEAVDTLAGTFEDAVSQVLSNPAVVYSKYPLEVCFYPNTPPLARITRKGIQEKECQ